jgi:hypothetical protein
MELGTVLIGTVESLKVEEHMYILDLFNNLSVLWWLFPHCTISIITRKLPIKNDRKI